MRRHVATLVAVALFLSIAGPAVAGEPGAPDPPAQPPVIEPTPVPEPTPLPAPPEPPATEPPPIDPTSDPGASPAPSASPAPTADPAPSDVPATEPPPLPPTVDPDPTATPADPTATPAADGSADPTGRWIVVYRAGTDAKASVGRQATRLGFSADRTFTNVVRGFTAKLNANQVAALRKDPSVAAVVPDEKIELTTQSPPTGIGRIYVRRSAVAQLDGVDQRVDADVAIVDTGIARIAELNVVGGYNCSTADRTLWRDIHGHGTHVAGTVGAIDNTTGVVGVAPGVRLWAVKILNDSGEGLLSAYVCGLDWIAAQRDPVDPSRPRIEAVNMSVAKYGRDDGTCGVASSDVLHAAICRLVANGVTVVAAAANDSGSAAARVPAAYNEVITVSALADTDANPGGLGGNRCYSWGTYDVDDTFADFSNYGSDVDLIAPGKCITSTIPTGYAYMSGTSMAAPHVAGAIALLKASRPQLTPTEVKEALQYLGNLGWSVTSDPDPYHEKLLDVQRIGPRGDFGIAAGGTIVLPETGGTAVFPITITRSLNSFERIVLRVNGVPTSFRATLSTSSLFGFTAVAATLSVVVPAGTAGGTYVLSVSGDEHGRVHAAPATIVVDSDPPVARPPVTDAQPGSVLGTTTVRARIAWGAAVDPTSAIGGYEIQGRFDGGAWTASVPLAATARLAGATQTFGRSYQYRMRARDIYGTWGEWALGPVATPGLVEDSSAAVVYRGTWTRHAYAYATGGTERYATAAGASARTTFTGYAAAIVGPLGPTRGSARVYVDGVYRTTISFRKSTGQSRALVYSVAFPSGGSHTIELRVVGNGRVDLDAFVTFR